MIIYCVRHGESCFNAEGRLQGQADTPLSPLGLRQAAAAANALAGKPIAAVYCSPLPRAAQTAEAIARGLNLPVTFDPRLMEVNVGIFQGILRRELAERFPAEHAAWCAADPDYRIPQGESRRDLALRGRAAFDAIRATDADQVVVVSHGGLLGAVFKSLLDVRCAGNPFPVYNASISQLLWAAEPKLLTLNQTEHLRAADCELASLRSEFL